MSRHWCSASSQIWFQAAPLLGCEILRETPCGRASVSLFAKWEIGHVSLDAFLISNGYVCYHLKIWLFLYIMLTKWKSHKTQNSWKYKLKSVSIPCTVGEQLREMLMGDEHAFLTGTEGTGLSVGRLDLIKPLGIRFLPWTSMERTEVTSYLCFY